MRKVAASRIRLAVALVAALPVAWFAMAGAVANVTQSGNPAMALRMNDRDPVALAQRGYALLDQRGVARANDADVVDYGKRSLHALALNGPALQLLGTAKAAQGEADAARRLFELSHRMSRRDLGTQLWMIEDAVEREDVAAALVHYDVALRVRRDSSQLLFPVLTAALEDPTLRAPFVPYVDASVPWVGAFFRHAIRATERPDALADIAMRAGGLPDTPEFKQENGLQSELIARMVTLGQYDAARRFYLSIDGADPAIFQSAELNPATTDPRYAPLTWQLTRMDAVQTNAMRSSENGPMTLSSTIASATRGVFARKLLMLPPGRYGFAARQRVANDTSDAELNWTVTCVDNDGQPGASLWSGSTVLAGEPRAIEGRFVVPAGCTRQFLTAGGYGGSGVYGTDVAIDSVALRPIR